MMGMGRYPARARMPPAEKRHHAAQRRIAETLCGTRQKSASGKVKLHRWVLRKRISSVYLQSVSSRFIISLASIVQAANGAAAKSADSRPEMSDSPTDKRSVAAWGSASK